MQTTAFTKITDALLSAGKTVNVNGDTAMAQCPAHDDRTPSLSLRRVRDTVLLWCFVCCENTTDDVLDALGLTKAALYDDPRGTGYSYPGGLIVTRTPNKKFSQRGNKDDTSLFQADRIGSAQTVYVCEGEKDVLAVESVGGVAVCSAMGAGKAHRADWNPLCGKDVVIIQHKDAPRSQAWPAGGRNLYGTAKSVRIVEAGVGNDAADHIAAGKTLDELVMQSLLDKLSVTGEWLDAQHFDDLEYGVPEMIPEGLTYLGAPPKKGKSFLVGNIAPAVASGGKALGCIPVTQRPVLYLALEDGHRRLQDRFRKMNGDQPIPTELTIVLRATPAEAMAVIAEYLDRHGKCKPLVILDTLGKVKRGKQAGEDSYQADYAISGQLKALADSAPGSAILVVHHTRKAASDDFVERLSGIYGIAGAADNVMVLQRSRGSDDAVLCAATTAQGRRRRHRWPRCLSNFAVEFPGVFPVQALLRKRWCIGSTGLPWCHGGARRERPVDNHGHFHERRPRRVDAGRRSAHRSDRRRSAMRLAQGVRDRCDNYAARGGGRQDRERLLHIA
jgi:AAA domain